MAESYNGLSDDTILLEDLKSEKELINSAIQARQCSPMQITKIKRVPDFIWRQGNFEKYYEAQEIALGPLHADSRSMKKNVLKLKLAAKFIETFKNIIQIKGYFDEMVVSSMTYDDDTLARMLFLDGCSILQFIFSYLSEGLIDFNINNGQAALIERDLFLMKNQVPFEVLLLLMKLCPNKDLFPDFISEFIVRNNMAPNNKSNGQRFKLIRSHLKSLCNDERDFKQPVHLLDLLRSEILFDSYLQDHGLNIKHKNNREKRPSRWSFRNVQDLKAAGIWLKPSYTDGLRSVSFHPKHSIAGQLQLPPLIVDETTVLKLLNMVAYEMCFDDYRTRNVTSYLSFLDSLIDCEEDVKDLRSVHILQNYLGSDAEVAILFNTIGSNLVACDAY